MPSVRYRHILMVAIIAAVIAAYASFSWLCPYLSDDYSFLLQYLTANGGSDAPSLSGYWTYVSNIWLHENGRLANMLCAPVVLWMPKWLWAAAIAAVVGAIYLVAARLAKGSWRVGPLLLLSIWVACIVLLPWSDDSSLIAIDFALNYLLSALLMLVTMWAAYHVEVHTISRRSLYCVVVVVGFLTGMCHEGASLPLVATFTLMAAIRRFAMPRQWWGIYIALLVGTAICVGSPAIWTRFSLDVDSRTVFHIRPYIRVLVKSTPLLAAMCAVLVVVAFSRKGRMMIKDACSDRLNLYLGLAAAMSAGMMIVLLAPPRASIWANVLLVILLLRMGYRHIHSRPKPGTALAAATALLLLICVFFVGVLYWQKRIFDEYNDIISTLRVSEKDYVIYKDTIKHTPWWTLNYPIAGIWNHTPQVVHINSYFNRPANSSPVLPTVLRDYDFSHPTPVNSNRPCYQAGNLLLLKKEDTPDERSVHNWRFTLSDGSEVGSFVDLIPHKVGSEEWLVGIPVRSRVTGPFLYATDGAY